VPHGKVKPLKYGTGQKERKGGIECSGKEDDLSIEMDGESSQGNNKGGHMDM
jgi:hypothetical protein